MAIRMTTHRSVRTGALLLAALLAACSDGMPTNPTGEVGAIRAPRFASIPLPSQVVIPGVDAGAFVNAIDANNSGRVTTEFWDNHSVDNTAANTTCNVGFYATGAMLPGCLNQTPGSIANQGGFSTYWGDGSANLDPSSFTFSGAYSYNVKLLGTFAGKASEIGWFTRGPAGEYIMHPVAGIGAKVINTSLVINTGGANWGFYISNTFNPDLQGCDTPQTACSDATGGFSAQPFQQFALMLNTAQTRYLVGIEDNELELAPPGVLDSDHNDYILSVEPIAPPESNNLGCSPGYWKNHNFPAGYSKNQLFSAASFGGSTFENAFNGMTLQQVLSQGGGGIAALGRQTVSAFFNALTLPGFEKSPAQVINQFNAAVPGSNAQYNALKDEFEALIDVNGRTCPNPTGK